MAPSSQDAPKAGEPPQPAKPPAAKPPSAKPPPLPAENVNLNDGVDSGSMTTSRLAKMYRERMLARGVQIPNPPPPPPTPLSNPLARTLLEAGGEVISKHMTKCVVKHVCGTRVSKFYSLGDCLSEVEAMRFVSSHTSIPVPRVYAAGEHHFTMEFIEGETLEQAWGNTLSAEDKTLLRAIKSPNGLICSFGGRPAVVARRRFAYRGGPFTNEAAYNDFLLSDLIVPPKIRDMIRRQMRTDHEIVLSHGDLHHINIMVRPGVGVVAIIDWEKAGYYPEYVDLVTPLRVPQWSCGYYDELVNFFPQHYDAEFMVDQVLSQWSRH
ncbi:kinase-like domain-containing protein [Chaetomium sp. MPI-CAGE-AT-0009]|nr:kinase-like domain-containing protein [Chaetomium sp. MPI-CAGE-AT-0009]